MRAIVRTLPALAVTVAIGPVATAQIPAVTPTAARTEPGIGTGVYGPVLPSRMDVVVVGKVVEIEPDAIDLPAYRGAPKDQKNSYKVAIVKIEDPILGASGITRVRVGYLAEAPTLDAPADGPPRPRRFAGTNGPAIGMGVGLNAGMEGCFTLSKHPLADFFVLASVPLRTKDENYAKEVEKLKKVARAMNDPVAALKAKSLNDRFEAAQIILQRYLIPRGSNAKEPIPDEENKLILALLAELPWVPADGKRVGADGKVVPHRSALWYSINPGEFGFKRPDVPKPNPGDPPPDVEKLMDEATTKFLKENGNKIQLKRFVQK